MPPTKAKTTDPAASQARKALEQRQKRREEATAVQEVTIEQRAIAATLRERDHREGCPAFTRPDGSARIEAYAQRAIAPGPELRDLNVQPGEIVVVVRCRDCGELRYRGGYERHPTPEAAVEAFTDDCLAKLADVDADDSELDEDLT